MEEGDWKQRLGTAMLRLADAGSGRFRRRWFDRQQHRWGPATRSKMRPLL